MSAADNRILAAERDAIDREDARALARVFLHVTPTSANAKTGAILVTTTSADTCPDACPLKRDATDPTRPGPCYAKGGPLALHWAAVSRGERGAPWAAALEILRDALKRKGRGALWRHNQAGDLPGRNDRINRDALGALVAVNAYADARGFTYTHHPVTADASAHPVARRIAAANLALIAEATASGFTINASANTLGHVDAIADAADAAGVRIPIVVVVERDAAERLTTPSGRRVVICPAQTRAGVSCATCRLCARADRGVVVGFRAHGAGAKRAEQTTREGAVA
jgi:hypothetical protein